MINLPDNFSYLLAAYENPQEQSMEIKIWQGNTRMRRLAPIRLSYRLSHLGTRFQQRNVDNLSQAYRLANKFLEHPLFDKVIAQSLIDIGRIEDLPAVPNLTDLTVSK